MQTKSLVLAQLCISILIASTRPQERFEVDIIEDIPSNGLWKTDCPSGYDVDLSHLDCSDYGGSVKIPPEHIQGKIGFWTRCRDLCRITYVVQDEDTRFAARIYQSNVSTDLLFDNGARWEFIDGSAWVDFYLNLEDFKSENYKEITLGLQNFADYEFTLLDKIVINGELDPLDPTATTSASSMSASAFPTVPTTSQETASTDETTLTSEDSSTLITTLSTPSTETNDGSSSLIPTFSNPYSKTTEESSDSPSTPSTPFTVSSSTFPVCNTCSPDTSTDSTKETDIPLTTSTESTTTEGSNTISPTSSTLNPSKPVTPFPPSEKEKEFIKETWLIFLMSFFACATFLLLILFGTFYIYPRIKRGRTEPDTEEIISNLNYLPQEVLKPHYVDLSRSRFSHKLTNHYVVL